MGKIPNIYALTKLLADESRINILTLLMDSRFHTVHEIAMYAKIKDQTTSYHLMKMKEIDWLESYRQGKNVYYRLSSTEIGELMETLMNISEKKTTVSYNQNLDFINLKEARSCYSHIAGKLGVALYKTFINNNLIIEKNHQVEITNNGNSFFTKMGLNIESIKLESGIFIKLCMDWTERDFHLSGNFGKTLFNHFLDNDYVIRNANNRSLQLTIKGKNFLERLDLNNY